MRTGNMSGPAKVIGLAVLLAIVSSAARADWRVDAETGALYDSNLSNSERASDVKDDWAWQSNLRVGDGFQLTRDLRLNLGVDLREQVWARFDSFNNVAPGGSASLRYRFGLGRLAPWVLVEDRLAYAFFKEGDNLRTFLGSLGSVGGGFLLVAGKLRRDCSRAQEPDTQQGGKAGHNNSHEGSPP